MKNFLSPMELLNKLEVAPRVEMQFNDEKHLSQYRSLLYSINGQKKFRFSTRRVYRGRGGPTLQVIRLK